jgi:L-ascorbate metabolism protein UlaG (beta-lactamase superfamily)
MPKLTFLGHDAFLIEQDNHRLVIDPFLSGNPVAKLKPAQVKVQYVLLTHAHGDHLGDGLAIAKANDAMIIAANELAVYCGKKGLKSHPMHIGGSFAFPFGRVKLTIAHHSSGMDTGEERLAYMGNPCGFLVMIGGKTIYHAGDTGLFLDMKLIGDLHRPDVALLPIGDNFTMGVDDAALAADFIHAKLTVPMHYNTFGVIQADALVFKSKVEEKGLKVKVMTVGESLAV